MTKPETLALAPEKVVEAREKLGELWGVGRPLSRIEFARALGLSPKNGNDHILNMELGRSKVSGPISILIGLYLRGSVPPDEVEIFVTRGRRRADPDTGEIDPTPPPVSKARRRAAEEREQAGA